MRVFPVSARRGFPGRRVLAYRAGITATTGPAPRAIISLSGFGQDNFHMSSCQLRVRRARPANPYGVLRTSAEGPPSTFRGVVSGGGGSRPSGLWQDLPPDGAAREA